MREQCGAGIKGTANSARGRGPLRPCHLLAACHHRPAAWLRCPQAKGFEIAYPAIYYDPPTFNVANVKAESAKKKKGGVKKKKK